METPGFVVWGIGYYLLPMDHVSPAIRSKIMAAVKSADTGPEMLIRRALHRLGYRYGLHRNDLPGKPDLVFRSRRKVVFVHGCFWHGHNCKKGRLPKTRIEFWTEKISKNRARDRRSVRELRKYGWSSITIWQCQTRSQQKIVDKIVRFLESR